MLACAIFFTSEAVQLFPAWLRQRLPRLAIVAVTPIQNGVGGQMGAITSTNESTRTTGGAVLGWLAKIPIDKPQQLCLVLGIGRTGTAAPYGRGLSSL
jgi:hypothetical protein